MGCVLLLDISMVVIFYDFSFTNDYSSSNSTVRVLFSVFINLCRAYRDEEKLQCYQYGGPPQYVPGPERKNRKLKFFLKNTESIFFVNFYGFQEDRTKTNQANNGL